MRISIRFEWYWTIPFLNRFVFFDWLYMIGGITLNSHEYPNYTLTFQAAIASRCHLWLNQGVTSTHFDSSEVLWCSGYHVCFTRRRSRVRTSSEPVLSLSYFHTSTCSVWLHCHQYSRWGRCLKTKTCQMWDSNPRPHTWTRTLFPDFIGRFHLESGALDRSANLTDANDTTLYCVNHNSSNQMVKRIYGK